MPGTRNLPLPLPKEYLLNGRPEHTSEDSLTLLVAALKSANPEVSNKIALDGRNRHRRHNEERDGQQDPQEPVLPLGSEHYIEESTRSRDYHYKNGDSAAYNHAPKCWATPDFELGLIIIFRTDF